MFVTAGGHVRRRTAEEIRRSPEREATGKVRRGEKKVPSRHWHGSRTWGVPFEPPPTTRYDWHDRMMVSTSENLLAASLMPIQISSSSSRPAGQSSRVTRGTSSADVPALVVDLPSRLLS